MHKSILYINQPHNFIRTNKIQTIKYINWNNIVNNNNSYNGNNSSNNYNEMMMKMILFKKNIHCFIYYLPYRVISAS
jgi:hypothetical protein